MKSRIKMRDARIKFADTGERTLIGLVVNHPKLGDNKGRLLETSEIISVSEKSVETQNNFYDIQNWAVQPDNYMTSDERRILRKKQETSFVDDKSRG